MSLDEKIWRKQLERYPEAAMCIGQSKTPNDALPSYEYLYKFKDHIPKELYAYFLRELLKYNTANVSADLRLNMLSGVDREDLMYQEELDALQTFGEYIVVYRGASKDELIPGISWSRRKTVAKSSDFYQGRLFTATVPTSKILLYISKDCDEEEIVAHITDDYKFEDE